MMRAVTRLSIGDLLPADLLLITGIGDISESIATLDGGTYSHVALYVGNGLAIEAKLPSVKTKSMSDVLEKIRRADVFTPYSLSSAQRVAVVQAAQQYEARGYSGSALLLNFFLFAVVGSSQPNLQDAGAKVFNWILESTEFTAPHGVAELTCAELVARAFADAGVPLPTTHPDDRQRSLDAFKQALRGAWMYRHSGLFRGVLPSAVVRALPQDANTALPHEALAPAWTAVVKRGLSEGVSAEEFREACALLMVHLKDQDLATWEVPVRALPQTASATWRPDVLSEPAYVAAEAFAVNLGATWHASLTTPRMIAESPALQRVGELYP